MAAASGLPAVTTLGASALYREMVAGTAESARRLGKKVGGYFNGEYVGGADDDSAQSKIVASLRDYNDSAAARVKEDMVARLANTARNLGYKIPTGTTKEVVSAMLKELPTDGVVPTEGKQIKLCNALADALNAAFTGASPRFRDKLIDVSLSPENKCRRIVEVVKSLRDGLHSEFLAVHAAVRRNMRSLEIIKELSDRQVRDLMEKMRTEVPTDVQEQVAFKYELWKKLSQEQNRTVEQLKGYLDTAIGPIEREIEVALRDSEDDTGKILESVGLRPGTKEFSSALIRTLRDLGLVATVSAKVDEAIRLTGIGVSKYLSIDSISELESLLTKAVKDSPSEETAKVLRAAELLRQTFGSRSDLAESLTEISSRESKKGGADEDDDRTKRLTRRARERLETRKMLLKQFTNELSAAYSLLTDAAGELARNIGGSVALMDKMDRVKQDLRRVAQNAIQRKGIELALIGYQTDAAARSAKTDYLHTISGLKRTVEGISDTTLSSVIGRIRDACERIESAVAVYSEKATQLFGLEGGARRSKPSKSRKSKKMRGGFDSESDSDSREVNPVADDLVPGGFDPLPDGVVGAADEESKECGCGMAGGDDADFEKILPEVQNVAFNLAQVVNRFDVSFYAAKVREYIARASKDMKEYSKDYERVIGDAIAQKIRELDSEEKSLLDAVDGAVSADPADPAALKPKLEEAKKVIRDEFQVKRQIYRLLEVIDLYARAFTQEIAADPDAVRDIKRILDSTQIIADWYSADAGARLGNVFDIALVDGATDSNKSGVLGHYYSQIAIRAADDAAVQEATIINALGEKRSSSMPDDINTNFAAEKVADVKKPFSVSKYAETRKNVSVAFARSQALKNLINSFVRVGDRFGGTELRSVALMSAKEMYRILCDYVEVSSMTRLFEVGEAGKLVSHFDGRVIVPEDSRSLVDSANKVVMVFSQPDHNKFENENQIFSMIMRVMVSKVLVAVGVYQMFETDADFNVIQTIRTTIGGASSDEYATPEVIPEATELYFRLPRLMETYRSLLGFDIVGGGTSRVSMPPELDGVFNDLLQIIFVKATGATDGNYSDLEMRAIIRAVNRIYNFYKEKKSSDILLDSVDGLINEVNRKYGLYKSEQIQKYKELLQKARSKFKLGDAAFDYERIPLLPGEGEYDVKKVLPSDQFLAMLGTGKSDSLLKPGKFKLEAAGRRLFDDFRAKLEECLTMVGDAKKRPQKSFDSYIRAVKDEISKAGSVEAKYAAAIQLIQVSRDVSTGGDVAKRLMFIDTVVVGIDVLERLKKMLNELREIVFAGAADFQLILVKLLKITGEFSSLVQLVLPVSTNAAIQLRVDFTGIRRYADLIFTSLKSNFDKLRSYISDETVDNYAKKISALEDELFDNLILGAPDDSLRSEDARSKTLDVISKKINDIFNASAAEGAANKTLDDISSYVSGPDISDDLKTPIITSKADIQGGYSRAIVNAGAPGLNPLLMPLLSSFNSLLLDVEIVGTAKNIPGIHSDGEMSVFPNVPVGAGFIITNSLVGRFNIALASLLVAVRDEGSAKTYTNLIQPIVNSVLSTQIAARGSSPITPTTILSGPNSLALFITSRDTDSRTGVARRLFTSLLEVPNYLKERMRGLLPYYRMVFEEIVYNADTLKNICSRTKLYNVEGVAAVIQYLDSLYQAAMAVANACFEVQKELADESLYFQSGEGAIEMYRSRYGKNPLAPLAFFTALNELPAINKNTNMGSADFKVLYGIRAFMTERLDSLSASKVPSIVEIVEKYNAGVDSRDAFNLEEVLVYVKNVATLSRRLMLAGIYESSTLVRAMGNDEWKSSTFIDYAEPADTIAKSVDLVKLIQGASRSTPGVDNRKSELSWNLIDIGRIPLNVMALMRDIPLVPSFNYDYTLRQLICQMYGMKYSDIRDTVESYDDTPVGTLFERPADSDRVLFLRFLANPTAVKRVSKTPEKSNLENDEIHWFLERYSVGYDSLGMGRPKYLSDSVFNEACLQSFYPGGANISYQPDTMGEDEAVRLNNIAPLYELLNLVRDSANVRNYLQRNAIIVRAEGPGSGAAASSEESGPGAAAASITRTTTSSERSGTEAVAVPGTGPGALLRPTVPRAYRLLENFVGDVNQDNIANKLKSSLEGKGINDTIINMVANGIVNVDTADAAVKQIMAQISRTTQEGTLNTVIRANKGTADASDPTSRAIMGRPRIVAFKFPDASNMSQLGSKRLDTSLIRNIYFIVSLQRLLRLSLHKQLVSVDSIVTSSYSMVNPMLTEYERGTDLAPEGFAWMAPSGRF